MHWRNDIKYDYHGGKWTVRQCITKLDTYSFDGDFAEAAKWFAEQKDTLYRAHVENASELFAAYFLNGSDGSSYWQTRGSKLKVQFDKLELDWCEEYDEKVLKVWGTRGPTEEELTALEADRLHREEETRNRELADYERLKKKFEKT